MGSLGKTCNNVNRICLFWRKGRDKGGGVSECKVRKRKLKQIKVQRPFWRSRKTPCSFMYTSSGVSCNETGQDQSFHNSKFGVLIPCCPDVSPGALVVVWRQCCPLQRWLCSIHTKVNSFAREKGDLLRTQGSTFGVPFPAFPAKTNSRWILSLSLR